MLRIYQSLKKRSDYLVLTHVVVDSQESYLIHRGFKKWFPKEYRKENIVNDVGGRVGDIMTDSLIAERKRANDLMSSSTSGRIEPQLDRMMTFAIETKRIPFLLVSDNLTAASRAKVAQARKSKKRGSKVKMYPGFIKDAYEFIGRCQYQWDITVIFLQDDKELVRVFTEIIKVHANHNEGWPMYSGSKRLSPIKKKYKEMKSTPEELFMANALRIDPTKAKRLMKTFGGYCGISEASVRDLMKIPGIGIVTAERIKKMIG